MFVPGFNRRQRSADCRTKSHPSHTGTEDAVPRQSIGHLPSGIGPRSLLNQVSFASSKASGGVIALISSVGTELTAVLNGPSPVTMMT